MSARTPACPGAALRAAPDPSREGPHHMRNNLENGLRDGVSTIAAFLPKLVVILIIGLLIAKAISKAANALLEKAGFDRAVERGGVKKALSGSKLDASDIVAKLVYYALALFVLQLAFGVF